MMIRIVLAAVVAAFAATAVVAQGDPIAARKALMKGNRRSDRASPARCSTASSRSTSKPRRRRLMTIQRERRQDAVPLFPDSSKTGDTAALPAIWENKADFDAKLAKFGADAKAAADKVNDLDSFKAGDRRGSAELRRLPQRLSQEELIRTGLAPQFERRAACPGMRRPCCFRRWQST